MMHSKRFQRWLLALWLCVGVGLRLYDLTDLPLDFHPVRQVRALILARALYLPPESEAALAAQAQAQREALIEPPLMEGLTALTYRLLGQELPWVGRLYAILFWVWGAWGVFLLARRAAGGLVGAWAALAYFLFLPYAIQASRSFQPDPLLTASIVWAVWAALRWQDAPQSWGRMLLAGLLAGLALLVKSVAVFFVAAAWLGVLLAEGWPGLARQLRSLRLWLAVLLAALPLTIFLLYGLVWTQRMAGQFSLRFFPALWVQPSFYWLWLQKISQTAGLPWVALAGVGVWLIAERKLRALLLGAWVGYFLYGAAFAYHITTHDYYQLPLLALTAISLAAVVQLLFTALAATPWLGKAKAALVVSLIGLGLCALGSANALYALHKTDYRPQAAFWAQVGQAIGPNERVLALTQDYGYPLVYWGWRTCDSWFSAGDFEYRALAGNPLDVREMFAERVQGQDIFLVTDFEEWRRQPELQQLLQAYPLRVQTDAVYIFDLKEGQR